MDPVTILAALGPLAVDLGKSLISRFVAPDQFKPATIEQYAKMRELDLEMFKAMNDAGGANPSYPWVEAIVRLQRPTIALLVIGTWAYMSTMGQSTQSIENFAGAIGMYLFADRTLFYARKAQK